MNRHLLDGVSDPAAAADGRPPFVAFQTMPQHLHDARFQIPSTLRRGGFLVFLLTLWKGGRCSSSAGKTALAGRCDVPPRAGRWRGSEGIDRDARGRGAIEQA